MNSDDLLSSIRCDICTSDLTPHPLHPKAVAMTCVKHGDFFVYRERGREPAVIFRPFENVVEKVQPQPRRVETRSAAGKNPVGRTGYTIKCDQTGAIFNSLIEAAWSLTLYQSDLSKHLQGHRQSVGGFTFTRLLADGLGNYTPIPRPVVKGESTKNIQIKCDQTGVVFHSIREAARVLKIGRGNIYSYLRGIENRKQVGGYTFTRVSSQ